MNTSDSPELSLRERKKAQTRTRIADTAVAMLAERGFDAVTVAEIARAAEVSEATIFNYFGTKEDLVYDRLDQFWDDLIATVANRTDHGDVVDAVERYVLAQGPPMPREPAGQQVHLAAIIRMITASPRLLARERASYDRAATALARVLAATTSIGPDAGAAAQMLVGVHRSVVDYTREQILDGTNTSTLNRRVKSRTRSSYALLRSGLQLPTRSPAASHHG